MAKAITNIAEILYLFCLNYYSVKSLKKIDFLFFTYLLISTLFLVLARNQHTSSLMLLFVRGLFVSGIFGIIYLDTKKQHPLLKLLRTAYPILLSGYFYSETVFYNKLLFGNIDPLLANLDAVIFGMQPSVEFSAYFSNKLLSEIMYFGYFSFYLLILGFTLYIFIKKSPHFNKAVFQLSASLYIFYFVFCLIPSAGPQFYFSYPENVLPNAWLFDDIMHFIQQTAEQPTGAFPSSHVGVSLILLILSKKYAPAFFRIAWPVVIILILSTVYIKAHYAIDVIGGIIFAPAILFLSDLCYNLPALKKPGKLY